MSANDRVLTTHLDLPNDLATRERIDLREVGRRVEGEVTGTPAWLVLFRGEEELRRVRVDLANGERTRGRVRDRPE